MKEYPAVFQWLVTNTTFDMAKADYVSNPDIQAQLKLIPDLETSFNQQWEDWHAIEQQKRYLGITDDQNAWIMDSRIMGEARNMVLDDLQEIGNGILFLYSNLRILSLISLL